MGHHLVSCLLASRGMRCCTDRRQRVCGVYCVLHPQQEPHMTRGLVLRWQGESHMHWAGVRACLQTCKR